jgi:hypothetical protein
MHMELHFISTELRSGTHNNNDYGQFAEVVQYRARIQKSDYNSLYVNVNFKIGLKFWNVTFIDIE